MFILLAIAFRVNHDLSSLINNGGAVHRLLYSRNCDCHYNFDTMVTMFLSLAFYSLIKQPDIKLMSELQST